MKADNDGITVDAVARIVHNAQRDLEYWLEDPYPPPPYDALPEELRFPVQSLVRLIVQGYCADYVQDMWIASMAAKDWKHGDVKDPHEKTHPCMVPFSSLPLWEKRRMHLAYDIVEGFARYMDLG